MVHNIMPSPEMLGNRIEDGVINRALIGIDDGAILNVLKKKMAHVVLRHIRHDLGADMAATFHHCDNRNFIGVLSIAGQNGSRIPWCGFPPTKVSSTSQIPEVLPSFCRFAWSSVSAKRIRCMRNKADLWVI